MASSAAGTFSCCIDFAGNARLGASYRKGVSITIFLQKRIQATFITHFCDFFFRCLGQLCHSYFVGFFIWYFVSSFRSCRFSDHQLLVAISLCKDLLENPQIKCSIQSIYPDPRNCKEGSGWIFIVKSVKWLSVIGSYMQAIWQ